MVNAVNLTQQRTNLASRLSRAEITSDTLAHVGCFADVQHLTVHIRKNVDPGRARQVFGEAEFVGLWMGSEFW